MQLRSATRSSGPAMGFTLIELMVVVAIVTILFSIAIPSYMSYIRQSRRTEAKTAVLDLAGREERFLSTNPTAYTRSEERRVGKECRSRRSRQHWKKQERYTQQQHHAR